MQTFPEIDLAEWFDLPEAHADGNARSLEPDTQLSENIVNKALIACFVCQPVHNVAVRMRGDRIDFWRRVHILLLSSDLDRRYRICRVPARRRQRSPPQSARAHQVVGALPRVRHARTQR